MLSRAAVPTIGLWSHPGGTGARGDVAAARELRDWWLEKVNRDPSVLMSQGKYEVSKPAPAPSDQVIAAAPALPSPTPPTQSVAA